LGRVLRAERGQVYELSDGSRVWLARVEEVKRERIDFSLIEELPAYRPAFQATLLLSVLKFDSFEFALEKASELGVGKIVPLAATRSEKALLAAAPKRAERWKKILLEASQQSRRLRTPELAALTKPEAAFSACSESGKILLSERPEAPSLRSSLNLLEESLDFRHPSVLEKKGSGFGKKPRPKNDPPLQEGNSTPAPAAGVALAIGPEGGWTDGEFACARKHGFREASLGRLILRAETAAIAALASLNYALSREES
jgi:16S rRNA (uracil1498-N3)-methyltransferase